MVPDAQQLRVLPQPSAWPQPALPKSAQVLGMHATQVLFWHVWPEGHGAHDCDIPQPRSIGAHPVTVTWEHVLGVQQLLLEQTSPVPQGAQAFCTPQPRSTGPQPVTKPASWASPHVWGVQQLLLVQTSPVPQGAHAC
jgi:hypothetical protein